MLSHKIVNVFWLLLTLLQVSLCAQNAPADHLLPPPLPLPTPQPLKHHKAPAYASSVDSTATTASETPIYIAEGAEAPGFMTRIARWFGLGPPEQQLVTDPTNKHYGDSKQAYSYASPEAQGKAPCNLCNKYPWMPMLQMGLQYPPAQASAQQLYAQSPPQSHPHVYPQLDAQASQRYPQRQPLLPLQSYTTSNDGQQLPVKQRAVQFNFPTTDLKNFQQPLKPHLHNNLIAPHPPSSTAVAVPPRPPLPFAPIPVPNLSLSALPPIYNAQNFRSPFDFPQAITSTTTTTTTNSPLFSEQQLPSTEPARFVENIGAHSELQPNRAFPTQNQPRPNTNEASFEIVKSHQLTDFVSSVEYPVTYEQSPSIDLRQQQQQSLPLNHKAVKETTATVNYQHKTLSPHLNSHIPASQILTQLGSFGSAQQQTQQQTQTETPPFSPQTYETSATHYTTSFEPQSHTFNYNQHGGSYEPHGEDNFPSASSHNLTEVQQQQQQLESLNSWLPQSQTVLQEQYTTTELPRFYTYSTTSPSLPVDTDYVTERPQESTVQFVPSLQTANPYQTLPQGGGFGHAQGLGHAPGSHNAPRPFTRGSNGLTPQSGSERHLSHNQNLNHNYNTNQLSNGPWLVTPLPPHTVLAAAPTPTSTYSAIDASGQFAGMTPPTPPTPAAIPVPPPTTHVHQIIIPYTTKNKPRPFEPTYASSTTTASSTRHSNAHYNGAFEQWSAHSNSVDIHEQQESKVVSAQLATEAPTNARRTTKYITKILASNLRELLRREHEVKHKSNSSSFDLSKLQKNIDGWTEQEYTSLSHRPSTPTIRGRSKHIPPEYLTMTTPVSRRPKTTSTFQPSSELPASINNLESLLLERDVKQYELKQIDDNHLRDVQDIETTTIANEITSREAPTAPTASGQSLDGGKHTPISAYVRLLPEAFQEPAELWRKAKVAISPQTHEKVYVVTPQPRFFPQRTLTTTTAPSTERPAALKSPRFLVRPTPGNSTSSSTSTSTSGGASGLYRPELFGLMGLSAYVPAKPVEIIDGNSKVLTTVTSAPTPSSTGPNATGTQNARNLGQTGRIKSTMSPSPR